MTNNFDYFEFNLHKNFDKINIVLYDDCKDNKNIDLI